MNRRTDLHTAPTELPDRQSAEAAAVDAAEDPAVDAAETAALDPADDRAEASSETPTEDDAVPASGRRTDRAGRRRPPTGIRRPALLLAAAAAGAVLVNVLFAGDPPAHAGSSADQATSVASQLDLTARSTDSIVSGQLSDRLGDLAATRSQREAAQDAATRAQAAADQAAVEAQQRAEAEAKAAADAQAAAEAKAAADAQAAAEAKAAADGQAAADAQAAAEAKAAADAEQARARAAAAKPAAEPAASGSGSFQDYALSKLGGNASQFSCLESLWGKESGWNPNAQNPSSTAYGIPQFLNSTWASTGIAKTSDGHRQIDAGLIYIDSRYGSPCGAWSHSRSTGWY
jgi:hypothetical protein